MKLKFNDRFSKRHCSPFSVFHKVICDGPFQWGKSEILFLGINNHFLLRDRLLISSSHDYHRGAFLPVQLARVQLPWVPHTCHPIWLSFALYSRILKWFQYQRLHIHYLKSSRGGSPCLLLSNKLVIPHLCQVRKLTQHCFFFLFTYLSSA